jgi:predicted Zn finger-like uncharacterized protein
VLTQCSNCQTVFRVTSTILRAAHGQVRCGKCNTQFDAIDNLFEGEEAPPDSNEVDNEHGASQYEGESVAHEDIVLEGNRIEISGVYRRPAVHRDENEDGEAHTTIIEEFTAITDEWENALEQSGDINAAIDDADEAELEDVEHELSAAQIADAMASLEPEAGAIPENDTVQPDTTEPARTSYTQPSTAAIAADDAASTPLSLDEELFGHRTKTPHWPWMVAGIALILLLATQSIHHARAALARHPGIGPQITRLYAAVGQPLAPQWQLQAYNIKQWGIVSDPQAPGTLRVRASVTNNAAFAQPYPLLKLALEDRFGGNVGTRLFKPEEYLSSHSLATRMLSAGEAANIDLAIVDPGESAVGFQFDTCLQPARELQCTHELPGAAP